MHPLLDFFLLLIYNDHKIVMENPCSWNSDVTNSINYTTPAREDNEIWQNEKFITVHGDRYYYYHYYRYITWPIMMIRSIIIECWDPYNVFADDKSLLIPSKTQKKRKNFSKFSWPEKTNPKFSIIFTYSRDFFNFALWIFFSPAFHVLSASICNSRAKKFLP